MSQLYNLESMYSSMANDETSSLNIEMMSTYFGDFIFVPDNKWRPIMFNKRLMDFVLSEYDEISNMSDEEKMEKRERKQMFIRLGTFINNPEYRERAIILAFSVIHFDFEDFLTWGGDFVLPRSIYYHFKDTDMRSPHEYAKALTFALQTIYDVDISDADIEVMTAEAQSMNVSYIPIGKADFSLMLGNPRYVEMLLKLSGDIEMNPGPVFSKPTFNRECTINVGTEGLGDWLQLPNIFANMTTCFGKFVEKIPEREEILSYGTVLFEKMEMISQSIIDSTQNLTGVMDRGYELLKNIVMKCVIAIVFIVLRSALGASSVLNTITNFICKYVSLTPYIQKIRIFNGCKVSTEGAMDDILGSDKASYLPLIGTAIFGLLFSTIFQKKAKDHDLKTFFQDAFVLNRGIDSLEGLFDKAFSIWDMITNKLLQHKIKCDFPVSKYEASVKVNNFMAKLKNIFEQDFDLLDFDDKKAYRKEVADLHKESVDILVAVESIDKKRQPGVRQMITLLNQKYTQVISQPLTGKMRVPMFPLLLSGGSGVGKTRLLPILQSISAKVIEKELGIPVSQDNVVALNLDADHADGYLGQFIVLFNDALKKKNTEMNPAAELDVWMSAVDQAPYVLKMADLASKGMFFTSLIGLISTNVIDIKKYAEVSQSYTAALGTRLKNCYKVSVLPCYRKYITPFEKQELLRDGNLFQHSVDPYRAKYYIHTDKFEACGIRKIEHANLLDTYTDEEFEKMPKTLIAGADDNFINTHIYRFKRYQIDPLRELGEFMDYSTFAKQFSHLFTNHLQSGTITLKEQTKFFNSTLEEMFEGTKVPTEGLYEKFVEWAWPKPQVNDCDVVEVFDDCRPYIGFEMEATIMAVLREISLYNNWEDFQVCSGETGRLYREGCIRFGDRFEREMLVRVRDMMTRRNEVFEKEMMYHGTFQQKYEAVKAKFLRSSTFRLLKQVGIMISGVVLVYGAHKMLSSLIDARVNLTNPRAYEVKKQLEERNSKKTWLEWFKDSLSGDNSFISITDVQGKTLRYDDLALLYEMYGICVTTETSSPGGKSQQRHKLLRLRAPTQVAAELVSTLRGVQLVGNELEFHESKINSVMVQTEALMSQLTETVLDHIIPSSQWYLYVDEFGIGNVTFLDGEHILMPYHYIETLRSYRNEQRLFDNSRVLFKRGDTIREQIHGSHVDKEIVTELRYLSQFKRIESGIPTNPKRKFEKDAVIVNLPTKFRSGTTCRDIKSKFIRRKDMARLSAIQCQGHMFNWRSKSGVLFSNMNTLTDITPINIIRENESLPLTEVQPHTYPDGSKGEMQIILTARYEYSISSQKGDCGSLLYIADNQLPYGIAGIHVSKAMTPGKSCSVPITYEDIMETLQVRVQTLGEDQIPTVELTNEELYAPDRIAPDFPYEVIGKIVDPNYTTYQPTKSSWRKSPLGERVDEINFKYSRQCNDFSLSFNTNTAILKPFVTPNQQGYSCINGKIYKDGLRLTQEQWEEFENSGTRYVSPLLVGLKKAKREIPFFKPDIAMRATDHIIKQLAQGGKKGYHNLSNYLSSVTSTEQINYQKEHDYLDNLVSNMHIFCQTDVVSNYFKAKTEENYLKLVAMCEREVEPTSDFGQLSVYYLDLANSMSYSDFRTTWPALVSMMFCQANLTKKPVAKIFDIRTAIKGIDGNRACQSMNAKSSPGYGGLPGIPYVNRRLPNGKKCWFGEDYLLDDTEVDIVIDGKIVCSREQVKKNFKELERDVERLLETAAIERPSIYFQAALKDEKRELKKSDMNEALKGLEPGSESWHKAIDKLSTRVFFPCDMATCIASKMISGPVWSWYINNNIENGLCIAINPYGQDWERIAEKMLQFGVRCIVAGDYGKYDQSIGAQLMAYADSVDIGVAERGGVTDEKQLNQMLNMSTGLAKKYIIANNLLLYIEQIVGSGSPKTCLEDCILNLLNMYYIFGLVFDFIPDSNSCADLELQSKIDEALGIRSDFEQYQLTNEFLELPELTKKFLIIVNTTPVPKISIAKVTDYILALVCGDDHLIAVAPEIHAWFNQRTIAALMKLIGMEYTDETKTGKVPPDLRTLEEVTFLKRRFVKTSNMELENTFGRKWVGPLAIEVVKEIALWRTNNQSIEEPEALKDNMKTALREMALHGKKQYNDMKKYFEFAWNDIYPSAPIYFEDFSVAFREILYSESDLAF